MRARAPGSKILMRQVALAACLLCFLTSGVTSYAQAKSFQPTPKDYVQFSKPDQAEGRRILVDFRQRGLLADLYLQFELRVFPRKGETRIVPARLWAGRNDQGPIWRLELSPGDPAQRRLLVQNGQQSALWSWQPSSVAVVASLGLDGLFERLADTDLTAFDLQMPFLYWSDFIFEGVSRVRGRPAHVFLMYPPVEVTARRPELKGVRVYLDTQFNALVQAEQIGAQERSLKSITVLDLKKVEGQWIAKSVDVRDEETRNKTRFAVTQAAVGQSFPPELFDPASLSEAKQPPALDRLSDVGP